MSVKKDSLEDDLKQLVGIDPELKDNHAPCKEMYLFIQTLIKRREGLRLTQEDIVKRSGLTPQQVSRIESLSHNPKLSTLLKYCSTLDITIISAP